MSDFLEIAFAAVSNRLCLFTGTGFSKAVTNNTAPSWQGLLEEICNLCSNPKEIKDSLFPASGKNPLSLDEAAQVLEIELLKLNKNIHIEIANLIKKIKLEGDNSKISSFLQSHSFRVITTNYDKLIEELTGSEKCQSLTPGLPIPRSSSDVKVYHVHGSIDSPNNMVVTSDDYFKFLNTDSYFSKKLSTILHENTVVILGYSLGDTNLKTIISDYKGFSKSNFIGSNLFFVSRSKVERHIKDYYSRCYGIRVIDNITINDFFVKLNKEIPEAEKNLANSLESIRKVLDGKHVYKNEYLKMENSFYQIIASVAAIGSSINNQNVVTLIESIIKEKTKFTNERGAWEQYEHLARWLIYLASILEIKDTSIEITFLDAVKRSMSNMSSTRSLGSSWHAYHAWNNRWDSLIPSNRLLINEFILKNNPSPDATSIVSKK